MASQKLLQVARQFSTSSVRSKLIQPPIQVFGVDGRYAHAIYSAASKEKKLDVVEKDLAAFQGLVKSNSKLGEFLTNPTLKRSDKKSLIEELAKSQKYSNLTVNLFGSLAENGRLNRFKGVMNAFNQIMGAHRGEVICSVTTAKALDNASQRDLKDTLQGFIKQGQTLQLEMKVDPSLIGGMIVNIGDRFVDMSMSSKIKLYTDVIKQAV